MASTLKAPIILFISMLALLPSCGDRRESAQLREIADAIGVKPDSALAMLDGVDTLTLNAADLHYFKLLSIKAADKAYVTHTSDSLIRQVIAYHEENPDTLLPEVYYYGGRVYSDLGDAPQALDYYQRALDLIGGDSAALNLRGNILSNMGQLMNKVYLYDQAIAHLKESAEIDSILGDLSGLHYDAQLLGHIYLNKEQEDSALYYYNKAEKVSRKLSQTENQTIQLLVTSTLRDKISPSEAKRIIYPIIADKSNPNRYLALGIGAYTYRKLGLRDSAEICAKALIAVNNDRLRLNGYASLVELYIDNPAETKKLYNAIRGYKENLNSVHGKTSSDAAIYQNSYYNYSLRERENNGLKAKALTMRSYMWLVTAGLILSVIVIAAGILLYRLRMRAKNAEIENRMSRILILSEKIKRQDEDRLTLSSSLEEMDGRNSALRDLVDDLFRERWETINRLCDEYFEKGGTESTRLSIVNNVEAEIKRACSAANLDRIESMVNSCRGNMVARLRGQCPFLREEDVKFLVLVYAGFSPRAICLFTGIKLKYYYNKRARLFERITKSAAVDKELFTCKRG